MVTLSLFQLLRMNRAHQNDNYAVNQLKVGDGAQEGDDVVHRDGALLAYLHGNKEHKDTDQVEQDKLPNVSAAFCRCLHFKYLLTQIPTHINRRRTSLPSSASS